MCNQFYWKQKNYHLWWRNQFYWNLFLFCYVTISNGGTNSIEKKICVYQPIMRRQRTSLDVFWSTGLVKISAQLWAEANFVILHAPDFTWSLKWFHLTSKCFVLDLCETLVAITIQPALSSNTSDYRSLSVHFVSIGFDNVLDVSSNVLCSNVTNICLYIYFINCQDGS